MFLSLFQNATLDSLSTKLDHWGDISRYLTEAIALPKPSEIAFSIPPPIERHVSFPISKCNAR